jgi:hypothetical protein
LISSTYLVVQSVAVSTAAAGGCHLDVRATRMKRRK